MPFTSDRTDQELLSVAEVAHLAGVTDTTIYAWIKQRDIPYYQTRRGIGIPPLLVAVEIISTGIPLLSLEVATTEAGGDINQAYQLDTLGRVPRIRLLSGRTYYTSFGVAKALGITNAAYIGSTEAAAMLGVSRTTIPRRIKDGRLQGIRLLGGGRQVIPAKAVTPVNTSGWLRVARVAQMWKMDQSSINRMCKRGELDAVLMGGSRGFYLVNPGCVGKPPADPITSHEFADIVGVSPRAIRLWYRQGKMRGWRLGHNWRWSRADAERISQERLGLPQPTRA